MVAQSQRRWRIVHSENSNGWGGQEHRIMTELPGFQQRGSQVWLLAAPDSQIIPRDSVKGNSYYWAVPLSRFGPGAFVRPVGSPPGPESSGGLTLRNL